MPFLRGALIGLVSVTLLGILVRHEPVTLALAVLVVGLVTGWASPERASLAGLVPGVVLSFPALVGIQFGTDVNTLINTESLDEMLMFWPFVILIWAALVGAAMLGFWLGAVARKRMVS
jgi:hypothetical protein